MIAATDVSAVIPTRGNVDMMPIIESLAICAEIIIWDNSIEDQDLKVYGRYAAIQEATMRVVYTQDDDCLVDVRRVCAHYEPGLLTANMPVSRWSDYPDSALVGWGSVFDRDLPMKAFRQFDEAEVSHIDATVNHSFFNRTCDVVFSTLTPSIKVDVGFTHLPWAETEGRMFTTPGHKEERDEMLALARLVRDRSTPPRMKGTR